MFRGYWHRRAYRKALVDYINQRPINKPFRIKKIRILIDEKLDIPPSFFSELSNALNVKEKNVSFMTFPIKNKKIQDSSSVFNRNEVSFFGKFSSGLLVFCEKEVDLQLNFFNEQNLYPHWVACVSKKKLSIGFTGADNSINDLIFDFPPTSKDEVKTELIKYLKILNHI